MDDTGRGIPDEGRNQLCDNALTNNECGPGICQQFPSDVEEQPNGPPRFVWETRCVYPEASDACDDDKRCTWDRCNGAGGCAHEPIRDCYDVSISAVVERYQTARELVVTLVGARPNAKYDVTIRGVPDVPDRTLVLTTDLDGKAEGMRRYVQYSDLPSTCNRGYPSVTITAIERITPSNRDTTNVSAHALRPCLTN